MNPETSTYEHLFWITLLFLHWLVLFVAYFLPCCIRSCALLRTLLKQHRFICGKVHYNFLSFINLLRYPVGYLDTINLHINGIPLVSSILGITFTWASFSILLRHCMCMFKIDIGWIISTITSDMSFITLSSIYVLLSFFPRGGAPTWLTIWRILDSSVSFTPLSFCALILNFLDNLYK